MTYPKNSKKKSSKFLQRIKLYIDQFIKRGLLLMVVVYVTLIIKGKKTIHDVPAVLKEQVKQMLIDLDLPELAEE